MRWLVCATRTVVLVPLPRPLVFMLVLVSTVLMPVRGWSEVGGGSAPGSTVSVVNGFLTESDVSLLIQEAMGTNCFLDSIVIPQADTCTYYVGAIAVPMVCIRCDMNDPMCILEAADRQGALAIYTPDLDMQMEQENVNMSPGEKTQVQRVGDFVSASASTQGRCINMPIATAALKDALATVSFDVLCSPTFDITSLPFGYAFASEGDHENGTEFGNWRGVVSEYWFIPWLVPFTAASRAIETPGMCPLDWFKVFCHGAWGTVYPSCGVNPAESQTMNLSDSAFDAMNPTYAPFFTYGPLHLRMGAELTDAAHEPASYEFGAQAMFAQVTRGAYIQPLFPTTLPVCLDTSVVANDVDPAMQVWEPAVAAKPITETNSNQVSDSPRYSDQQRNIAAVMWPRFTCCNWCAGSVEAPARHEIVGAGFWPQLIDGR